MRKVEIWKWEKPAGETRLIKVKETEGIFIQYGYDCNENDLGLATYSTGIVELSDGSVRNVPVEMLKFIDNLRRIGSGKLTIDDVPPPQEANMI